MTKGVIMYIFCTFLVILGIVVLVRLLPYNYVHHKFFYLYYNNYCLLTAEHIVCNICMYMYSGALNWKP